MSILTIDPGSTYTGWCISWDPPFEARRGYGPLFGSIRVGDRGIYAAAMELRERIGGRAREIKSVYVEQAPIASREDKLGNEADIGWKQGWAAAHMALVVCPDVCPIPVQVSAWREAMIIQSTRGGFLVQAPRRTRDAVVLPARVGRSGIQQVKRLEGGRFDVEYRCGHKATAPDYEALAESFADCAQCATPPRSEHRSAEEIRDAWKELACKVAHHWWPDNYDKIVQDARSRARAFDKPDHQLQGVPDACEAAGISVYAHSVLKSFAV
jgi:hypothetical protein